MEGHYEAQKPRSSIRSVQYGEQDPWDGTSDGTVKIFDLILAAAHFGG